MSLKDMFAHPLAVAPADRVPSVQSFKDSTVKSAEYNAFYENAESTFSIAGYNRMFDGYYLPSFARHLKEQQYAKLEKVNDLVAPVQNLLTTANNGDLKLKIAAQCVPLPCYNVPFRVGANGLTQRVAVLYPNILPGYNTRFTRYSVVSYDMMSATIIHESSPAFTTGSKQVERDYLYSLKDLRLENDKAHDHAIVYNMPISDATEWFKWCADQIDCEFADLESHLRMNFDVVIIPQTVTFNRFVNSGNRVVSLQAWRMYTGLVAGLSDVGVGVYTVPFGDYATVDNPVDYLATFRRDGTENFDHGLLETAHASYLAWANSEHAAEYELLLKA